MPGKITLSTCNWRVVLSIFFIATLSVSSNSQHVPKAKIDSLFVNWDKEDSPGCALGIIRDGQLVYGRGYGMANLEYKIPNTTKSIFRIASTSKQFTAACIIHLHQKGLLELNDPLSRFFPEFPTYADRITVTHLLNHTSGIRDYLTLAYLSGYRDDDFYTDEEVMNWLINQKTLNFSPGEEHLYSNSGYWLLGQIVKKISGQTMAEYAKENIFSPLGMTNTHFHDDFTRIVPGRSTGYSPKSDGDFRISMTTLNMIGDGGIFTSIEEMKLWDDAFYRQNVLNGEFWKLMTARGVLNNGDTISYASGLDVDQYKGKRRIHHGGSFVGYRAMLMRFPDQKTTIVILANRSDANPTNLAERIADLLFGEGESEVGNSDAKTKDDIKLLNLPDYILSEHSGQYVGLNDGLRYRIEKSAEGLRFVMENGWSSEMLALSYNEFILVDFGNEFRVVFSKKGDQKQLSFYRNEEKMATCEAYEPFQASEEILQKFIGNYYSDELSTAYHIEQREGKLQLSIRGRKIGELEPVKEDIVMAVEFGMMRFKDLKDNTFGSFDLNAGRVKNLEFIRNK